MKAQRSAAEPCLSATDYEKAVLEFFKISFPPPRFEVRHDVFLVGKKSRRKRQIDIAIFEFGVEQPHLIIEAKRHGRRISLDAAGSTIALIQDVGRTPAVMVSTMGFSEGASRHLAAEGIDYLQIKMSEAASLRWMPYLETFFSIDVAFKRLSGQAVEALRLGNTRFFESEDLPFEEWEAAIKVGLSLFPRQTINILRNVAAFHSDDGHRFQAIQILSDQGELTSSFLRRLRSKEGDSDIIELLDLIIAQSLPPYKNRR